jgi:hypothetical protein
MSEETKDVVARDEAEVLAVGAKAFGASGLMDGVEIYLPKIQIIHQGALFEMPDGETVKSFKGTILDIHKANAYWSQSLDDTGVGVFPECHSLDGITPEEDCENRMCDTCVRCSVAYNNAKKVDGRPVEICCKNTKRLHILVEGSGLPYRLVASVKNIKPVDVYVSVLTGMAAPYPLVETEFSLKKVSSKGGQEYSELVLKRVGMSHLVKTKEDVQKVKDMIARWKNVMRGEVDFDIAE